MKTNLRFEKLTGTGNDFVMFDAGEEGFTEIWQSYAGNQSKAEMAKKICDRHFGVGADGILFLHPGNEEDFRWEFFNSDGSKAEMCGNAARCAALFAQSLKPQQKSFHFLTEAGPVSAEIIADQVKVTMPAYSIESESLSLDWSDGSETGTWLNTGVPHFVLRGKNLDDRKSLYSMAADLRKHPKLGPAGANITLTQAQSKNLIRAMSFERGVEDFTLACGTGAVAAALAEKLAEGGQDFVVQVPGGELRVEFVEQEVYLTGPARRVFIGELC